MYFSPLLSFMSYARNVFWMFSISLCFIVSGSFLPVIVAFSTKVCFQVTIVACTEICSKFPPFLKLLIARYHLSCEEITPLLLGTKYSDQSARGAIISLLVCAQTSALIHLALTKSQQYCWRSLIWLTLLNYFLLLQYF